MGDPLGFAFVSATQTRVSKRPQGWDILGMWEHSVQSCIWGAVSFWAISVRTAGGNFVHLPWGWNKASAEVRDTRGPQWYSGRLKRWRQHLKNTSRTMRYNRIADSNTMLGYNENKISENAIISIWCHQMKNMPQAIITHILSTYILKFNPWPCEVLALACCDALLLSRHCNAVVSFLGVTPWSFSAAIVDRRVCAKDIPWTWPWILKPCGFSYCIGNPGSLPWICWEFSWVSFGRPMTLWQNGGENRGLTEFQRSSSDQWINDWLLISEVESGTVMDHASSLHHSQHWIWYIIQDIAMTEPDWHCPNDV